MTRPEAIRQIESPIERKPKRAKVPRQVRKDELEVDAVPNASKVDKGPGKVKNEPVLGLIDSFC